MKTIFLCVVAAAALTGAAAMGQPAVGGDTSVQLIYHSDTRGYYLPCG